VPSSGLSSGASPIALRLNGADGARCSGTGRVDFGREKINSMPRTY
jgi:hypothetical protein